MKACVEAIYILATVFESSIPTILEPCVANLPTRKCYKFSLRSSLVTPLPVLPALATETEFLTGGSMERIGISDDVAYLSQMWSFSGHHQADDELVVHVTSVRQTF